MIFFVLAGYGDIGLTPKDENEVEVDQLSKAFSATAMKEDYVPFILFGVTRDIDDDCFSLSYNVYAGILKNGEDATIERLHYMSKREFKRRAMVWNNYIIYWVIWMKKVYQFGMSMAL